MDTRQCLKILELENVTSIDELKQAYRKMAKSWHPDRFHGNPREEQLAEVKLKGINRAYNQLCAYFDPDQSKHLKTSSPSSNKQFSFHDPGHPTGNYQRQHTGQFSNTDDAGPDKSAQFDRPKIYPASKKSVFGRLALFGVFCFFIAISCLVVYFIVNMDELTSKSIGTASEVLDKMKSELEKDLAAKVNKDGEIQLKPPPPKTDVEDIDDDIKPDENQKYYEIYLDGGTIIMTKAWWHEGDMVMYKKFGGAMGVEKKLVKRIVER
jgi:preprotein translocase subunit Sec63